jgi:hypothetical protein
MITDYHAVITSINFAARNESLILRLKWNLAIIDEAHKLRNSVVWARSISVDTKSRALLKALNVGFEKMAEFSAPRKAVIFTESRRTQSLVF